MATIVGGCDVGSATGKAVIFKDDRIAGYAIIPATTRPEETAHRVMDAAMKNAGLASLDELEYVVGTGYGRAKVPFAKVNISEITCHARGAYWLFPSVRTVIDIGGQDCKVIGIEEDGKVRDFIMNDKCAAGTGRFFEAMARTLEVELPELSALALSLTSPPRLPASAAFSPSRR